MSSVFVLAHAPATTMAQTMEGVLQETLSAESFGWLLHRRLVRVVCLEPVREESNGISW